MRPPRLAEIGDHRPGTAEIIVGRVNPGRHHHSQRRSACRVHAVRRILKRNATCNRQSKFAQRGLEHFPIWFFRADLVSCHDGIE